jgi:hypothetical protein
VRGRFCRPSLILIFGIAFAGCAREDEEIRLHRQAFASLGSTMAAIDEAWLDGKLSGTFTVTALEQTLQLAEQERTALAASPEMLADPRGARLSQSAEQLSRLLAATIRDVRAADAAAVRRHLADNPLFPQGRS